MLRRIGRLAVCLLALSLVITPDVAADDSKEAWAALAKGGHVALIRHGNAPPGYGGDPPGFTIDDCQTNRRRRLARPSASTACAWTGSCPPRCADAWTRPA